VVREFAEALEQPELVQDLRRLVRARQRKGKSGSSRSK